MTEPAGALAARIERFEQSADPGLIWDPAAPAEAEQAMRACAGDRSDAATWRLIGMLHLARYRLDQRITQDAAVAGAFFAAVAVADPGRLPERLRGSKAPSDDSADTWAGLVEEVFQHVDPATYPHVGLLVHALVARAMADPTPEVADRLGELLLQESVRSPDPAWAPGALAVLGGGLVRLFGVTGEREHIDDAVHVLFRAALAEPSHAGELATALGMAAFGDEELVRAYLAATETAPRGQDRSRALLALVELAYARSAGSFADRDLLAFIRVGQCALDFWHEQWAHPGVLAPYAAGLVEWFVVTGDERSLEAGTEMLEALHVAPDETARGLGTDPVVRLGLLGDRRWNRYGVTGEQADLESAIEVLREAAELMPNGHPYRARQLANLADALLERATVAGGDPAEPVAAARAALAAHGERDPARAEALLTLGRALHLDLSPVHADEAVAVLREALAAGERPAFRAEAYELVSEVLRRRAAHTGRVEDLHEAVEAARQGLELAVRDQTPDSDGGLEGGRGGSARRELCRALLARFSAQGDPRDLGEVLTLARDGDPELLARLGTMLDGPLPPDPQLAQSATELALALPDSPDGEVAVKLLRYAERQADSPGEFLLEAGQRLRELGRRRTACAVLGRAAEVFGAGARMAYALSEQGLVHQELGELDLALESFDRSAAGYRSLGAAGSEALQLGHMGLVLLQSGHPARAFEHHQRAATLCEDAGLAAEEAAQQGYAAEAGLAAGDPVGAVSCAARARDLYLGLGDARQAALVLVPAARAALDQDDLTATGERIAACAIELEAAGAWEEACRTLDAQAVLLAGRGHPGHAAACETRLVEIVRRRGERREPADEWYRIARRRRERGDADGARMAYQLAEREYEALGHYDGAASARYNLAVLAYAEGDTERALEEFGAAGQAFARLSAFAKEASALTMRASCLILLDRLDDASEDLERALELAATEGDVAALLTATLGQAELAARLGSWQEAGERLGSALGLAGGDPLKEAVVHDRLAALAARTGELAAQVEALEAAAAGFLASGLRELAALTSIKLGFALEARGEFHRARTALESGLTGLDPALDGVEPTSGGIELTSGGIEPTRDDVARSRHGLGSPRDGLGRTRAGLHPTHVGRGSTGSGGLAGRGGSIEPGGAREDGGPGQRGGPGERGGPAEAGGSAESGGSFELIAAMGGGGGLDAELLARLASIQLTLGDVTRGHATLAEAIRAGGDQTERLETWLRIEEAEAAGDLETARALAERALNSRSVVSELSVGGRSTASGHRSFLLVKLSAFCRALGDLEAAHAYAARGYELRDRLVIDHLRNLGAAARGLGRPDEAAEHLTQAVALARDADAALPADLVRALDLLGRVRTDQARWEEAAEAFDEGLELVSSPIWRALRVSSLAGRAALHLKLGELAEAEARYREAIAIGEELGGRPDLADAYADLSLVCALRGEREQAGGFAGRALELERAGGRTRGVVLALIMRARLEDPAGAEVSLEEAADLAQRIGFWPGAALALGRLGALDLAAGSYTRAHWRLTEAVELLEELGHDLELGLALHHRSLAAEELGDPAGALADAERARELGHDSDRAIGLAVRLGRGMTAWRYVEQAKSRTLAAQPGLGVAHGHGDVPGELLEDERRGLDAVRTLMAAARNTRDPAEAAALIRRARAARADVEALWRRMEPFAPGHVALRRGTPPGRLQLDTLVTPGHAGGATAPGQAGGATARVASDQGGATALVGFHVGEESVTVLAHRTGWPEPRVFPTTVGHDLLAAFTATIDGLRPDLLDIEARRHRAALWRRLADLLLADALDALKDGLDHLYLVPHAGLHRVPLHALAPNGRPLIERFPVTYAPSVAALARLAQRASSTAARSLVLGCTAEPRSQAGLEDVAALLGTQPLTGPDATATTLSGTWDVVHLSCQAVYDARDPFGSGIRLADGLLTARRLMSMNLDARLVVLTAQEGGATSGDDLAGLTHALLHAGARSVLLPLWPVSAEVTAALMRDFHTRLRSGTAPAQALREAVLELRDLYGPAEPDLWAPYVLVGL
ncbi:CHAT domain-containing tetratricopeptide repeat protein [Nonomuraea helvata]|uniref:CHAT domain-containing tetratricopeptide repeat protein n=1 Tax=Nonomuraea helvata TaxID=37484 RepID=A0ABV5SIZ8_9ACTN